MILEFNKVAARQSPQVLVADVIEYSFCINNDFNQFQASDIRIELEPAPVLIPPQTGVVLQFKRRES